MKRAIILLLLLLASCGQDTAHSAALRHWRQQPIAHYTLRTTDVVGGRSCDQLVEVRDEQVVHILSNTCQHPNLWTVGWLFRSADRARTPDQGCALHDPAAGCICAYAPLAHVEYDAAQGYPRLIEAQIGWQANWLGLGFWLYATQHLALPACTPPGHTFSQQIVVNELRPLP